MKFNKFLLRVLCFALVLAVACGVAAKLHVDNKEYKVEFDANGGTGVESQYVVKGGLVTAPADPTREGYSFLGWFHNEDLYNFETPVKGAMTLVAHWEMLPAECPHADKNDDGKCDACGYLLPIKSTENNDGTVVPETSSQRTEAPETSESVDVTSKEAPEEETEKTVTTTSKNSAETKGEDGKNSTWIIVCAALMLGVVAVAAFFIVKNNKKAN